MTNELTDVRCPCGDEFPADSYDAGFIAGAGMCQNCDAAMPPKDIPAPVEQAGGDEREAAIAKFAETCPMTAESAAGGKSYDIELRRYYLLGWDDRAALAQPSQSQYEASFEEWLANELEGEDGQPVPAAVCDITLARRAFNHWPKLEQPAKVGGVRFSAGVSSRLVVEAAQRLYEFESTPEKEAERPEIVARVVHSNPVVLGQCGPLNANDELMTVAQHAASVARWAEMFNRVEQQRDAALAEVERLRQFERICEGLPQDAIDGGWTVQGIRGYAKRLEDQLKVALARVAELERKLRDEENAHTTTIEQRDNAEHWADQLAKAIAERFGVDIGEHSNLNCPWNEALVWMQQPPAQAQHSVPGKYDDVLLPFLKSMEHELHANAGKGDRPGWLQMDRKTALLEIYYHLGKLQKATRDNDQAGIVEYAADVANMSMMLVDVCGLLAAAPGKEGV